MVTVLLEFYVDNTIHAINFNQMTVDIALPINVQIFYPYKLSSACW